MAIAIALIVSALLIIWGSWPFLKLWQYGPFQKKKIITGQVNYKHFRQAAYPAVIDIYDVKVNYQYQISAKVYQSQQVSFFGTPRFLSEKKVQKYVKTIEGLEYCLVSTHDPSVAILTKVKLIGERNGRSAALVAGVLITGFCWVLNGMA